MLPETPVKAGMFAVNEPLGASIQMWSTGIPLMKGKDIDEGEER